MTGRLEGQTLFIDSKIVREKLEMHGKWMRDIGDIAETLINGREDGHTCSLLIGAGCSASAGIPLASGFVAEISNRYKNAYLRADPKDYPHCMDALFPGQRRDLIHKFVEDAKINPAHKAIALLMKSGFVDRVLTTNFDSLVLRACANVDLFPGVYDFAVSDIFSPNQIYGEAIFHLHGQHNGFLLLNTKEEVNKNKEKLAPVFSDAGSERTWLVVGYSGENDPIFELLSQVNDYQYGLFWVGFRNEPPSEHVMEKLLRTNKHACYVEGYDADEFFSELANKLKLIPLVRGWTKE